MELEETQELCPEISGQSLLDGMREQLTMYLTLGLRYAHQVGGVDKAGFWRGLHIVEDRIARLELREPGLRKPEEEKEENLDRQVAVPPMPEDPYALLDLDGITRYLEYGRLRSRESDESRWFYESFPPVFGEMGVYLTWLERVRRVARALTSSGRQVPDWQNFLLLASDLTECLDRNPDWRPPDVEPPVLYWTRMRQECTEIFGDSPVSLREVSREVFRDSISGPRQRKSVEKGARALGLEVKGETIYSGEDIRTLTVSLILTQEVGVCLDAKFKAIEPDPVLPDEHRILEPKKAPESPRWSAMSRMDRTLLERRGNIPHVDTHLISILAENFVILIDDTMIGTEKNMGRVTNLLRFSRNGKTAVQVEMDMASVYSLYRRQRCVTDVEPGVYRDLLYPEEKLNLVLGRDEAQEVPFGKMVKNLSMCRRNYGLRITSGATPEGGRMNSPWEALIWRAESSPETRFLVLTRDRKLGRILARASTCNLVAAMITEDDNLLFFRETWPIYQAMLSPFPMLPYLEGLTSPIPVEEDTDGPLLEEEEATRNSFIGEYPKSVEDFENAYNGGRNILNGPEVKPDPLLEQLEEVVPGMGNGPQPIRLGRWFTGESGGVYATLEDAPDRLARLFPRGTMTDALAHKLERMMDSSPAMKQLCWPESLLRTPEGKLAGYVMPLPQGMELNNMIFHSGVAVQSLPRQKWNRVSLVKLAREVVELVVTLEEEGILLGAPDPHSFRFTAEGTLVLLDCERCQMEGEDAPAGADIYLPPEVLRECIRTGVLPERIVWTPEGQDWAMAVFLFQILMLGHSPFESRSGSHPELWEGIVSGRFVWAECEDEPDPRKIPGPLRSPAGRWRSLWLSTPKWIRDAFTETFTGHHRRTLPQWCDLLDDYLAVLEEDQASADLFPDQIFVLSGTRDRRTGDALVEAVCRDCRRKFLLPEGEKLSLEARGLPVLCDIHRQMRHNFRRRTRMVVCPKCGAFFQTDTAAWMGKRWGNPQALCPSCRRVSTVCANCGKTVPVDGGFAQDLKKRRLRSYCSQECFDQAYPRVLCSCGKVFRMRRQSLERLNKAEIPALCPACRTRTGG